MDGSILTSQSFIHMIQICFWWSVITALVVGVSYFTGNLSHPLTRAMKRISKLRTDCLGIVSNVQNSKLSIPPKEIIKALKKIIKRKKSVVTSINVYIYDDDRNNLNQGAVNSALNAIEKNCKEALSSAMEGDSATIIEKMNECSAIAMELYKRFEGIIKKESHDKLLNL